MAFRITGEIFRIHPAETFSTASGTQITRRSMTLLQRRFDRETGEELSSSYPTLELSGDKCALLDRFHEGDRVEASFEISGVRYTRKSDGTEAFFNTLRCFKIDAAPQRQHISTNAQPAQEQQPAQQPVKQQAQQERQSMFGAEQGSFYQPPKSPHMEDVGLPF